MTSQTIITELEFVLVVEQESEPSIITTEVEIVVLVEDTEVVLLEATEQGPAGADGVDGTGDLHYVHNQAVASGTWTITHNLGKRPAISLLSVGGLAVWGEVLHVDTNQALVYFDNPFAGSAICS